MSTSHPAVERSSADADTAPGATPLLISLPEIAALAKVQRPVVSMWRSRFSSGTTPFPRPMQSSDEHDRFEAIEVARWLRDTNHGNNPDAVADVAAFATVGSLAVTDVRHADAIAALLALRAFDGRPLVEGDLTSRAAVADPNDEMLAREIAGADPSWRAYADQMADAAYSTLGAWQRLHERRTSPGKNGTAGSLSPQGGQLVTDLTHSLLDMVHPGLVDTQGELSASDVLATVIASFDENTEVEVHVPTGDRGRSIRRELTVRGLSPMLVTSAPSPSEPAVHLARLRGEHATAELAQLEELVVGLSDAQHAIVLGPDTLLTEPLFGEAEASRDAVLRSGRVRGIVRLPQGLILTAPRQSLAVWLIGGPQGGAPLADRFTLVGDLRGVSLTAGRTSDVVSDLVTSLGTRRDVLAHAFRFLRFVRTSALLAGGASLVKASVHPSVATPAPGRSELPALLDAAAARLELDLPLIATTTASPVSAPVEDALEARDIRIVSGTRLSTTDTAASEGFIVLGRDEVLSGSASTRRINRLHFAATHPRSEITRPGDVVFVSGTRPRALVDVDGASVVEYPARILRVVADLFVPEIVAADINAQASSTPWKRWMLRRIAPGQLEATRYALHHVAALRADAERHVAELTELETLMVDALAAGVVTAESTDELSEPHDKLARTTEGTN